MIFNKILNKIFEKGTKKDIAIFLRTVININPFLALSVIFTLLLGISWILYKHHYPTIVLKEIYVVWDGGQTHVRGDNMWELKALLINGISQDSQHIHPFIRTFGKYCGPGSISKLMVLYFEHNSSSIPETELPKVNDWLWENKRIHLLNDRPSYISHINQFYVVDIRSTRPVRT